MPSLQRDELGRIKMKCMFYFGLYLFNSSAICIFRILGIHFFKIMKCPWWRHSCWFGYQTYSHLSLFLLVLHGGHVWGSKNRFPGIKSWPYCLLYLGFGNLPNFYGLHFLICKMRIFIILPSHRIAMKVPLDESYT